MGSEKSVDLFYITIVQCSGNYGIRKNDSHIRRHDECRRENGYMDISEFNAFGENEMRHIERKLENE